MTGIRTDRIACAVEFPGVRSLAPVLLLVDGTYAFDPSLNHRAQKAAREWVRSCGDRFRNYAAAEGLLDQ
ncbi:hypothetical protein [Gordonia sihwensis]|uniref:hypothetical protein n=1 Tax=Gordonia sihwensis TaxID=173559 RepID=UPI0005EEE69E|nr:hypothetical protein [Gordonia sihwensis]KJR10272.1 hypothetical protein UG54_01450 [Gordonia sihwensis]